MSPAWHPYRHVLPLAGERVLWAPDLDGLAIAQAPALHAALRDLRAGLRSDTAIALEEWLLRQGYLGEAGAAPPLPEGTPDVLVSRLFDPVGWEEGLTGAVRAFLYTGDGRRAFAYAFRPDVDPCGRCLVRRWLSAREDSPALRLVVQERLALAFAPQDGLPQLLEEALGRPGTALLREAGRTRRVRFLPVPGCCPPLEGGSARRWYGHPLALVKEVARGPVWTARTGSSRPVLGGVSFASGSGTSRRAAVGEALERYGAAWLPPDLAWRAQAPAHPFAPGAPYRRATPREALPWLPVRRVWPRKGTGLLPAESVLLLREGLVPPPDPVPTLSHGLACGRSLRAAFTAAVLEVLERDATARFWGLLLQGRADARRMPTDAPGELLRLTALGGAPTAVVFLRDPAGGWCSGAATRPTFAQAAAKARDEALHNLAVLRESPGEDPGDMPADFRDHARYYWHRPDRFPLEALRRLPPGLPAEEPPWRLRPLDVELFVRDLTPSDVRSAGFRVLRAHAPELLALPAHHGGWPVGLRRWMREVGGGPPGAPHPFA